MAENGTLVKATDVCMKAYFSKNTLRSGFAASVGALRDVCQSGLTELEGMQ